MKVVFAGSFCAAALALSGCSTSGGAVPSSASMASALGAATSSRCATAWIAHPKPLRCKANPAPSSMKASSGPLLYVSDIGAETVDVFSYPAGKPVGTLKGFEEPNGLCSDAKGDVFVTDAYAGEVLEYAHGGTKPIATLEAGASPVSCSVDPLSGDLAVTDWTNPNNQGFIDIFKGASGTPTTVTALYRTFYCTYDGSGNLFVDGFSNDGIGALGEVPAGSSSFSSYQFSTVGWPGGMAWDGSHVVVGDQFANKFEPSRPPNALYQVVISRGSGEILKTITLGGGLDIVQAWLQGKTVIGPDAANGDAAFYKYPKGGNPTKSITGFDEPIGATVSE